MAYRGPAGTRRYARRRAYSPKRRGTRIIDTILLVIFVMSGMVWLSNWLGRDEANNQTLLGTTAASSHAYYARCADARAAGAAPIYRGQPGYRPGLDADNDGVACEPYYGR